jgi:hypothetical protein
VLWNPLTSLVLAHRVKRPVLALFSLSENSGPSRPALRDGAGENDQTGLLAARIAFVIADDPVGAGLVAS